MIIDDLVRDGILKIASLPSANWRDIEGAAPFTVPLIAEDYPAKTALMWNAVYAKFTMPDHNSMMVADPKQTVRIMQAFRDDERYRGGGAGIGFKEAVIQCLDDITPLAKAMGAVNIIRKMPDGSLAGDNTDGTGYVQSLEKKFELQGRKLKGTQVLILGAGGSGRAISFALAQKGAHLTILNRTEKKAEELAEALNVYVGAAIATGGGRALIPEVLSSQDAVISVVDDAQSPLDEYSTLGDMESLVTPDSVRKNLEQTTMLFRRAKPDLIVSDIRIRKTETPMLARARQQGMPVLDGIPMVVNQGVAAFWWLYQEELTERSITRADIEDVMRRAVGV